MTKFKVLTVGNPKTLKGEAKGYLTAILHLAPSTLSGFNTCPMATEGCKAACLNTAGRGGLAVGGRLTAAEIANGERTNMIQKARIRKTQRFYNEREAFMTELVVEIAKAKRVAAEHGLKLAVRLNGTSDIRWERVPVGEAPNVMTLFPDVPFYDYTKITNRRDLPTNYHLTFSLADGNDVAAFAALANGMNVAAVFRRADSIPAEYMGRPTFNGDESDLRFLDPKGVVVALYAKGNARKDTSGFVRL